MDKFDISPFLKLANAISSFRDQNPETLMKMYREITCRVIGKNKREIQLSPVSKLIFLLMLKTFKIPKENL
jgi:hypothetical protein